MAVIVTVDQLQLNVLFLLQNLTLASVTRPHPFRLAVRLQELLRMPQSIEEV